MKGGIILEFKADSGAWGTMFGVPCVVADNFLKLATGEQIKVLLYLLRCSGRDCTAEEISANTGVSVQESKDAVLFWQQVNVLTPQQVSASLSAPVQPVSITGIINAQPLPENETEKNPPGQKKTKPAPYKRTWSGTEIAQMKEESADIAELFEVAESHLGILNHSRLNSLIYMHESLGLKKEVIITLISYCCMIGKTGTNYIEKIAYCWAEDNINTFEQAQEEVQRLTSSHEYVRKVMRILEVERLAVSHERMVEQWKNMNITDDMISYAYELTVRKFNNINFNYLNGIIVNWHEKGIRDMQGVNEDNNVHQQNNSRKYNRQNDDFDAEKYSRICINNFEVI